MKTHNGRFFLIFVFTALFFNVLGATSFGAGTQYLWQSRDQFVALEQIEHSDSKTAKNAHPYNFTDKALSHALASIIIQHSDDTKSDSLFTQESLDSLTPHLQSAFTKASSDDDIIFAVIGLYKSLFGFARTPKVTTGRMFIRDGKLNLIFGMIKNDVNEREDRRINPFIPGSREKASSGAWKLLSQPAQNIMVVRNDTIQIDLKVYSTADAKASEKPISESKKNTSPQPAKNKKVDLTQEPNSFANRLIMLKELKDKELITEQEYKKKRDEILKSL